MMQVTFSSETGRWQAAIAYNDTRERAHLKDAGMRWNPGEKIWQGGHECADNLRRFIPDAEIEQYLEPAMVTIEADKAAAAAAKVAAEAARRAETAAKVEASRATDSDLAIPAPEGLAYLPYQRADIAYAWARRDTLIADEPGLGKTIQALGIANMMLGEGAERVWMLVVAPKIALWNWKREAEKWLMKPHTVALWTTKKQPDADIIIVNYDIAAKLAEPLRAISWDMAVFDEAHALKTEDAKRTVAILGSYKSKTEAINATRRLFLTGTPILNRPVELFPMLKSMGFPDASRFRTFAELYCGGHQGAYGYKSDGATRMPQLQERLRASLMVRRLKADVLPDLAPKRYSVVQFEQDTPALRAAVAAEQEWAALDSRRQADAAAAEMQLMVARQSGDEEQIRAAIGRMRGCGGIDFMDISTIRHATAFAKVPLVVEHLVGLLDGSDESILCMAHHGDVIEGIVEGLRAAEHDAAVITGSTSDADRQRAQDDIQSKRKRVFVGSMRACGVAITLSAATTVVFAEQDWTPGVMVQAEDRAHRIGQQGSVLIQYLVVDGSIDVDMANTVAGKAGVIDAALDAVAPVEVEAVAEPVMEAVAPEPVSEVVTLVTEPALPRRGREPGAKPRLSQVERNKAYRERNRIVDVSMPAALAERLRALREALGETNAELLAEALALLESLSVPVQDASVTHSENIQ